MWGALSTDGSKFEMYDVGRTRNYADDTGTVEGDGTLAILQQNPASGYDKAGQDVDSNLAVKIGYDDQNLWATQNGASGGGNANTNLSGVDMWWWIK